MPAAEKYSEMGETVAGLGVFVNSLRQKTDSLEPYLKQLNDIDMQVAELEGVVAALDRHTSSLEGRFKKLVTPEQDAWD